MFWAKFKKPKMSETLVMDENTGETAETSRSSDVPASQPPTPILPDTPPDAMGHRDEDYGLSGPLPEGSAGSPGVLPASESAVVPVLPDASAVVPGENAVADAAGQSKNVAEALKRLTTVDLDAGAKPGALKTMQLGAPTSTAVWMTVEGKKLPVIINLTPTQCKAAGFELVSAAGLEPAEATTAEPSVAAKAPPIEHANAASTPIEPERVPATPVEMPLPSPATPVEMPLPSPVPAVPATPVETPLPSPPPVAPVPASLAVTGSSTDGVKAGTFDFTEWRL